MKLTLQILEEKYKEMIIEYISTDKCDKSDKEYNKLIGFGQAMKLIGYTDEQEKKLIDECNKR